MSRVILFGVWFILFACIVHVAMQNYDIYHTQVHAHLTAHMRTLHDTHQQTLQRLETCQATLRSVSDLMRVHAQH